MKVVYLYDTLCGWCMVASPEIRKLTEQLPETVNFEMLHANLFDANYAPELNPEFLDKVRQVGFRIAPQKTGVRFSEAYIDLLQTQEFSMQSAGSALAVAAATEVAPDKAVDFARALQNAHFLQGLNPNLPEVAMQIALVETGIASEQYQQAYESVESQQRMAYTRQRGRQLLAQSDGQGVPQLLLLHDDGMESLDPYDANASLQRIRDLTSIAVL